MNVLSVLGDVSDSLCSGGEEQVWAFTPATSGTLTLTLTSATDQA